MTTVLCLQGTKSSALRRIASAMESAGIFGWFAYEKSHRRCRLLPFCARTLIGIPPVDLCVTTGDHLLLNVLLSKEQLSHGSPVPVLGDPSDSNLLAHHKIFQVVSSSFGWRRFSSLANKFRSVDAGESNPFSCCDGAGITVVAGGDHDGCKSSKEHQ